MPANEMDVGGPDPSTAADGTVLPSANPKAGSFALQSFFLSLDISPKG
jgi:hypothetical protein